MGTTAVEKLGRWIPACLAFVSLAIFVFYYCVIDTLVGRGQLEAVNGWRSVLLLHSLSIVAYEVGEHFYPYASFRDRNVLLPAVSLFVLGSLQWYLTGIGIAQLLTGFHSEAEQLRNRLARYVTLAGCFTCVFVDRFTNLGAKGYLAWSSLILYAITALVWSPWLHRRWLIRRRPPPGHCVSCGYDLTGNVSGRCPECGASVAEDIRIKGV